MISLDWKTGFGKVFFENKTDEPSSQAKCHLLKIWWIYLKINNFITTFKAKLL